MRHRARLHHAAHRETHGDECAGDGRGARAAVGLNHVAVEEDGALAQLLHVGDGAQRAADEPLNLVRAAASAALGDFARRARQRGARQHAVFAGDPAFAAVAQERRHRFLDGRGADDARVAQLDEARAFGGGDEVGKDVHRPHLFGRAIVGAEDHKAVASGQLSV